VYSADLLRARCVQQNPCSAKKFCSTTNLRALYRLEKPLWRYLSKD
jgi:hypothetical protein